LARVPLVEQELFTLPKHQSSPPFFSGVHVARFLVFCVVFCSSLFVFFTVNQVMVATVNLSMWWLQLNLGSISSLLVTTYYQVNPCRNHNLWNIGSTERYILHILQISRQQTIGTPFGTSCTPLLADLFLYSYESDFIHGLLKKNDKKLLESGVYFLPKTRYLCLCQPFFFMKQSWTNKCFLWKQVSYN
jgi:hypothetical protein